MEIKVAKASLYPVLHILQSVADKGNLLPILSHAVLEATGSGLRLLAGDLEVAMEHWLPDVMVQTEGKATVPCRKIFEVVREMPEDQVHIRLEEPLTLRISCQDVVVRLNGLDPSDYPDFKPKTVQPLEPVPTCIVAEMIDKTVYAVATENVQFNLTGVHVEKIPDTGDLRFVATDGHRLSLVDRPVNISIPQGLSVIIPKKGVTEVRRILSTGEAEMNWGIMDQKLVVHGGGSTLYIRLVDGVFPSYQDVIPRFGAKRARLNRQQLFLALKRAAVLSAPRFPGVNLEFSPQAVRILSSNPDLGDYAESIPVDYNGTPLSILFNPKFLTDVLGVLNSESVTIEVTDDYSPVIIRDPNDDKFLSVVMPMRS